MSPVRPWDVEGCRQGTRGGMNSRVQPNWSHFATVFIASELQLKWIMKGKSFQNLPNATYDSDLTWNFIDRCRYAAPELRAVAPGQYFR